MVLLKHEAAGVALQLETFGKVSRFSLELRSATREQRDGAARSLTVFAELLAKEVARSRGVGRS